MRPRLVVVADVVAEQPAQMLLAPRDDVVRALPAKGADDPLRVRVLPGTPR